MLYRNPQAESLMMSRYGDAIAAQAVTDTLADGWTNGVADRTIDIYGPPRRTLTIRAAVIDDGRRPLGVVAFIEDVSERRRLEDIRRDFIANVSHELKTPMGAMGLLAETLQFERDPVVANRLAERINSEAFRVSRIIEDLLDLSRIEGEGSPTREPVSVSLIVADAIERIRIVAEQQNVRVDFHEPEIGYVVGGDRRQLISAVQALLENAVEYSPDGGKVVDHRSNAWSRHPSMKTRPRGPWCASRSRTRVRASPPRTSTASSNASIVSIRAALGPPEARDWV